MSRHIRRTEYSGREGDEVSHLCHSEMGCDGGQDDH